MVKRINTSVGSAALWEFAEDLQQSGYFVEVVYDHRNPNVVSQVWAYKNDRRYCYVNAKVLEEVTA